MDINVFYSTFTSVFYFCRVFYVFLTFFLIFLSRFLHLWLDRSPCYVLRMLFFLFIFLWPPYAPTQVNGGSWNFYTWWTLSVNREVTTLIFSWSSLNYRVGQKVTKFGILRPRPQTFCSHARTRQNIVILKKNLLSTDVCSTRNATFGELWPTKPWDPRATKFLKKWRAWIACDMPYCRLLDASTTQVVYQIWSCCFNGCRNK